MNYLAHLYLAGTDPEVIFGNFIADHVKGSDVLSFGDRVQKGILMHRAIDAFTDRHDVVRLGIVRLRPYFHKYAGVVVDMFYDHFLSKNWNHYSDLTLNEFTRSRFNILNHNILLMPQRSARLLHFMEMENWLANYGTLQGMQKAFEGMARRTSFVSNMENATERLLHFYDTFEREFNLFFPELQEFVTSTFAHELSRPVSR